MRLSIERNFLMFYEIFLSLCQSKNCKPTNVVSELGFSSGNLSKWKGGSQPHGNSLKRLAEYFNVTTDYLLGNDTSETKDPATEEEIKFALFNGSDGITDEMYEEVKNFAEMVKLREQQKKGKK